MRTHCHRLTDELPAERRGRRGRRLVGLLLVTAISGWRRELSYTPQVCVRPGVPYKGRTTHN